MGIFTLTDNIFRYTNQEKTQDLLNLNDYLSNKSKISLHRFPGQEHPIVSDLILRLLQKVKAENEDMTLPVIMMDVLFTTQLIHSSQPFRVLEYGCQDGLLSSHLAELLGFFHQESTFVCACNTLDFTSLAWMERIADIEQLPKLSYFAGDYGQLQLEKHSFDIVVINGSENYTEPFQILSDAISLAAEDGILLCYTDHTPLLESTFKLFFEDREEYEITPFQKIYLGRVKDRVWQPERVPDSTEQIRRHLNQAENILSKKKQNHGEIIELVKALYQDSRTAATEGNTYLKIQSLEQRERLLSYLTLESAKN